MDCIGLGDPNGHHQCHYYPHSLVSVETTADELSIPRVVLRSLLHLLLRLMEAVPEGWPMHTSILGLMVVVHSETPDLD